MHHAVVRNFSQILHLVLKNQPLVIAVFALLLAQALKVVTYYLKERKIDFRHLTSTGGLPSSHTAMVCALSATIGMSNGWASPEFALSSVFASIVMYDAAGVRRAAGKQARILNQMMNDLVLQRKIKGDKLTELLGHTPFEVFAGAILGIFVAFLLYK